MLHVEAVSSSCGVVVVLGTLGDQPVIRSVVDAPEAQRRPEVVALRSVVVDDVEDDFNSGLVQGADHSLEFVDLLAALAAASIFVMRCKKTNRVVAPVVAQRAFEQLLVLPELVA